MRLILIGPPGSGKGTQAKLLCERHDLAHIATGDILREAIRQGTPAGKRAEPFVVTGQLVPDDLVNEMVAELFRRDGRPNGFVLDGYPRTVAQSASFDAVLRQQFLNLTDVVFLQVDDEEIVRRLSGRWTCPKCQTPYHIANKPPRVAGKCDLDGAALVQRTDDRAETVRNRLAVYRENTAELVPFYRRMNLVREVTAEGPIADVFRRIEQAVTSSEGRSC